MNQGSSGLQQCVSGVWRTVIVPTVFPLVQLGVVALQPVVRSPKYLAMFGWS